MSLKDTTVYDKLDGDNWEEWEQHTLNLLDTKNLRDFTEVDYGPVVERAKEYRRLRQQEVLSFTASSPVFPTSSGKDSASAPGSEKSIAALQKASTKVESLTYTIKVLRSTKLDEEGTEKLKQFEAELAFAKEKVKRLKGHSGPPTTPSTVKTINALVYPGKTDDEIKSHLESVRDLETGSAHTHALLSASVSKGLKSYVQAVTKGKPNPYLLWQALKERFHNKSLNLQANLQRYSTARKESDEHMMDFIARLQQLRLQASTTSSPIGDDSFIARLRAGLPSEYNATQSTIASYIKTCVTIDTTAVDHITAILLDHEMILENLEAPNTSALWTGNVPSTSSSRKPNRSSSTSSNRGNSNAQRSGNRRDSSSSSRPTPARNMNQYCTFHEAPGHTIDDCIAAKVKHNTSANNANRDTGKRKQKRNGRARRDGANLVSTPTPTPAPTVPHTAHVVNSPPASTTASPSAALADAQWPTDGYESDDRLFTRIARPSSVLAQLPALPRNPFPAPIVDSGCTSHLTGHLHLLHKYVSHTPRNISVANNTTVVSLGVGIIRGHILINGKLEPVKIKNVQHVPDIPHTLISPLQLEDNGLTLQWRHGHGVEFYQGTRLRLYTIRRGRHIILPIYLDSTSSSPVSATSAPAALLAVDMDLIHRRLGHACEAMCRAHIEQSDCYTDAEKARLLRGHITSPCRVCALGKQVAAPHQKRPIPPSVRTQHPGEIISADLLTTELPSTGGARYILAVTDVRTRYHWTAPLKLKSDAGDKLRHIILSMPESQQPRILRTDGGGEFFNARLDLWLNEHGIQHPPAPPYTSEYNGLSERFLRTLMARIRCCLLEAGMPNRYWAEACLHATYLINVTPTKANVDSLSPYHVWHGYPPPAHTLRVFGARGTMIAPGKHKTKLQPRTVDVRFLSNHPVSTAVYRVLIVSTGRITHSLNVVFDEAAPTLSPATAEPAREVFDPSQLDSVTHFPLQLFNPTSSSSDDRGEQHSDSSSSDDTSVSEPSTSAPPMVTPTVTPVTTPLATASPAVSPTRPAPATSAPIKPVPLTREQKHLEITTPRLLSHRGVTTKVPTAKTSSGHTVYANPCHDNSTSTSTAKTRSTFSHALSANEAHMHIAYLDQHYHMMALALNLANHLVPVPTTLHEVLASSAKDKWLVLMKREFDAIVLNGTFELCPLPQGHKAISTHWVLKIKHDGSYKAHWVVHGFSQHEGINYINTYAPILRLENLCFLLAYAILKGFEIHSMDVNNAFLQALLDKDIYIMQAEGFESKEHPDYVCHLICALYSLCQALLTWNHTLNQYLLDLGFEPAIADPCIYHYHQASKCSDPYDQEMHCTLKLETQDCIIILSVYVDDLLLIGHLNDITFIKQKLHERFCLKDLGPVTRILGITIQHDFSAGMIDLSQPDKIMELAIEFGLADCKPDASPCWLQP